MVLCGGGGEDGPSAANDAGSVKKESERKAGHGRPPCMFFPAKAGRGGGRKWLSTLKSPLRLMVSAVSGRASPRLSCRVWFSCGPTRGLASNKNRSPLLRGAANFRPPAERGGPRSGPRWIHAVPCALCAVRRVRGWRVALRTGAGVAGGARRNAAAYSLPPGKLVGGTDGQRGDFKENQIELGELGAPCARAAAYPRSSPRSRLCAVRCAHRGQGRRCSSAPETPPSAHGTVSCFAASPMPARRLAPVLFLTWGELDNG